MSRSAVWPLLTAAAVAARALVRPGDRVLVESPGYPNAAQAFAGAGARLSAVPVAADEPEAPVATTRNFFNQS